MKTILLDLLSNAEANVNQPQSREELLKEEILLKKPIVYQEKPRIKLRTDLSYSMQQSNPKPVPNPLPEKLRNKIARMAGEEGQEDFRPVLVTQKVLKKRHISKDRKEFGFPVEDVENQFLRMEEERSLEYHHNRYMTIPIIEPTGKVPELHLRKWNFGINGVFYVLTDDWKDLVRENRLREGMTLQLWAFRIDERLHFAFVFLPRQRFREALRSLGNYMVLLGSNNSFGTGYPLLM